MVEFQFFAQLLNRVLCHRKASLQMDAAGRNKILKEDFSVAIAAACPPVRVGYASSEERHMPQGEGPESRDWIATWVAKLMRETGMGASELARRIGGVTPQRLSQVKGGDEPPSLELLWRIATVFEDEEEYAAMSDAQIRERLDRLIVSLKPRRLVYLASLSSSTAQALVDSHDLRESGRNRIASDPPSPSDDEEKT